MARIPSLNQRESILVKLLQVEPAGVWIESQDFTDKMMEQLGTSSSRTTLILFVPFHNVDYIVSSIDTVSLSETSYGLLEP
ncbi:MAG: hypothetical protein JWO13_397 [Acidobacteriales bacterium]|nr:hypothetical protein [Terriglobales bacterium]